MGFLQILVIQRQRGGKTEDIINFYWKHRGILNITYEIIIATYNVMWHNPSSNCCTKCTWVFQASLFWERVQRGELPAVDEDWSKEGLIGRIQLMQISGIQWAEWGCWENWLIYLQGLSLASLKSHGDQAKSTTTGERQQLRPPSEEGKKKIQGCVQVDKFVSKSGWKIRHAG